MDITAGILIVLNNKVLLCHPTNASWINTFSPPKGLIEDGESIIDAAIRECFEETSIVIDRSKIGKEFIVNYKKGNFTYKRAHLFLYQINSLSEIQLTSDLVEKEKLQIDEVDWVGFISKEEANKKIFWRFKHILDEIFN